MRIRLWMLMMSRTHRCSHSRHTLSCHQPPVSPDHHTISSMIHCFLQTYKCCNCCMFCMFTPPRLWSNSLSVGSSVTLKMMFIQDPDDWMMTWGGHWSADTGTSGVQRDPGDIQCREHFRYLQPSLTAGWLEKLLLYRQDLCTIKLLYCQDPERYE